MKLSIGNWDFKKSCQKIHLDIIAKKHDENLSVFFQILFSSLF